MVRAMVITELGEEIQCAKWAKCAHRLEKVKRADSHSEAGCQPRTESA